jgi:hypothetical protein
MAKSPCGSSSACEMRPDRNPRAASMSDGGLGGFPTGSLGWPWRQHSPNRYAERSATQQRNQLRGAASSRPTISAARHGVTYQKTPFLSSYGRGLLRPRQRHGRRPGRYEAGSKGRRRYSPSTLRTSSAVFFVPSFRMTFARWISAVRGLMPKGRAASLLEASLTRTQPDRLRGQ